MPIHSEVPSEANDLYVDSLTAWPWQSEKDGDQTVDEFDEVGAVQGNTTFPAFRNPSIDPSAEYPVLQADFIADAPGDLVLTNNLAEMIASYVLVYGTNTPIPEQLIDFGDPLTVTIIQPVNAEDDTFPLPGNDILEESVVQLDVLANDFLADPATGPMTIDPNGFVDLRTTARCPWLADRFSTRPIPTSLASTSSPTP